MWCQWVKSYLLKHKSFWEVKMQSSPSWVWRKLLNPRPFVLPHIKSTIGNGRATSLFHKLRGVSVADAMLNDVSCCCNLLFYFNITEYQSQET